MSDGASRAVWSGCDRLRRAVPVTQDEISSGEHPVGDGIRLAIGTLTVFPTRPPRTVDRSSGSWAMTFAPLVGLLLAAVATLGLWLLGWATVGGTPSAYELVNRLDLVEVRPASPLLAAALIVGLLALLTRAIHLDGLADTADGLGSGRPAEEALAIMRRSDIGPFGVVALVLILVIQVVAVAQHVATGRGALAVALALVVSRLTLPVLCSRGVPAARRDGLGRVVAGSVSPAQLVLAVVLSAVVLGVAASAPPGFTGVAAGTLLRGAFVAAVALLSGGAMCLWCVRRFGGVTGDVLGACVEVTFTTSLVVLTFL